MKLIKILNWAKINDQFISRKEAYLGEQSIKSSLLMSLTSDSVSLNSPKVSPLSASFISNARDLDFIYHIGGFDAVQLQTQIVDFLELFFRFGKQPIKPTHFLQQKSNGEYASPLSLFEMSRVLQSIKLIHSSSSPIFFSSCCKELVAKWSLLTETNRNSKGKLVSLAKSVSSSHLKVAAKDATLESDWFKDMVFQYQEKYIQYLEDLGMEKTRHDFSSSEVGGIFGGALYISDDEMIDGPTLFLRKFFPNKVIIVQCGFYSYFATVNVLTFDYTSPDEVAATTSDFENECTNMIHFSHIVSFSYDFHLRYIQDILNQHEHVDLPIDLPRVLRNFTTLNPRKAKFARNRVVRGNLEWKDETADLFRYILKNPFVYGFKPFFFKGLVTGLCLTVDSLNPKLSVPSEFLYTLVVCEQPEKQNERGFYLEYFGILVDKNHSFPHKELENGYETAKQVDLDPLIEYISSGYYLRDIVTVFEQKIDNLVQKVWNIN
jgi:hypothetical protein